MIMILLIGLAFLSTEAAGRIPVEVTGAPEEQMARRFDSAVRKGLAKDPRFIIGAHGASGAVTIALPGRLGWERRLDWTEIHYQARISSADGRTQVVAGYCWNWNLALCVRQIADSAAQIAAK